MNLTKIYLAFLITFLSINIYAECDFFAISAKEGTSMFEISNPNTMDDPLEYMLFLQERSTDSTDPLFHIGYRKPNDDGYGVLFYDESGIVDDSQWFYQVGLNTSYAEGQVDAYDNAYEELFDNNADAGLLLGHARNATGGYGAHPFRFNYDGKTYTFIHNGSMRDAFVDSLKAFLDNEDPNFISDNTIWNDMNNLIDSEIFFFYLMWFIDSNNGEVIAGIKDAMMQTDIFGFDVNDAIRNPEYYDTSYPWRWKNVINFVLSDGEKMYVFRNSPFDEDYIPENYPNPPTEDDYDEILENSDVFHDLSYKDIDGSIYIKTLASEGGTYLDQLDLVTTHRDFGAMEIAEFLDDTSYQSLNFTKLDSYDYYGSDIGVDGNFCVVGSYRHQSSKGIAYILKKEGGKWIPHQSIVSPNSAQNNRFGYSVAISGNYIVIGEPGNNGGEVYLYEYNSVSDEWTYESQIPNNTYTNGQFGYDVSISDQGYIAVGDAYYDTKKGAIHVYHYTPSTFPVWDEIHFLSGTQPYQMMGYSVANNNQKVVFGSPYIDIRNTRDCGAVHFYSISSGFGYSVLLNNQQSYDRTGASVAINSAGEWVAGGFGSNTNYGCIYVNNSTRIDAPINQTYLYFGSSVSINDDYVFAGAKGYSSKRGRVYQYIIGQSTPFEYYDDPDPAVYDYFGQKVFANNDDLMVGFTGDDHAGTSSGAAFRFEIEQATFLADRNIRSSSDAPELEKTSLSTNYPNPFNPITKINYYMAQAGKVEIEVFNIKGALVKTLIDEIVPEGQNSVTWNGKDLQDKSVSSGVYFYKMKAKNFSETKRMILMK